MVGNTIKENDRKVLCENIEEKFLTIHVFFTEIAKSKIIHTLSH